MSAFKHLASLCLVALITLACAQPCDGQGTKADPLEKRVEGLSLSQPNINLALSAVAREYRIPIGIEMAARDKGQPDKEINVTIAHGNLRDVLNAITETDSRYTWVIKDVAKSRMRDMRSPAISVLLLLICVFGAPAQTIRSAEDYLNSAAANVRDNKPDEALNDLNKALELDPRLAPAYVLRGNLRGRKKDVEGALSDYERALKLTPDARGMEVVYNNRSVIRLSRGDTTGALADINNAIRLSPRVGAFYNQRAIIRLQEGDAEGSIADYEKALELNPNLASAHYGRGAYYFGKGDLDKAAASFDRAIELLPNYSFAYVSSGVVRCLKGDLDGALADMKKGVSLDPSSASEQGRGKFSSPPRELNQFIESNPTNARAYVARGFLRRITGRVADSEHDFRRSLNLNPRLRSEIDKAVKKVNAPASGGTIPR
jgi:tetratricopeptide (TPR) repeat protein